MNKDYLWEKAGPDIRAAINDPAIYEIMLNPDGRLWLKHKEEGNVCVGTMEDHLSSAFVNGLAQYENKFLNSNTPFLDGTLPFNGERINITIPPITEDVSFNIRKKSKIVFTLRDYVKAKSMTKRQAEILTKAIRSRKNILVSGSPASGKTTLTNALLDTLYNVAPLGHRVVLLEQVPELQCCLSNRKSMVVSEHVSMNGLLWISMRNSPDRIVIGEVRDGAALDMLKAWNTGCPGGIATIHANNPRAAVQRVLDLSNEVSVNPPYSLAAEALDIIVHIEERASHPAKRVITEIVEVLGFDSKTKGFSFKDLS